MGQITVINLGKAYKQYQNRWSRLAEWVIPGNRKYHTQHWVLEDINFHVSPGEAVGILGVNGAGKSTLLKIITGTTQPTTGSVEVAGRVAALLELGMGFHPDFTGRENVYMSGQLSGLSIEEVRQLMSEIEAFAGIGEYLDQPVRMYSSGMQMRLAFSVATARRPEILIVDEALAVGDAAFQRKCFQRIESFRDEGTTLLLVSHDIETVKKLCDRAIFIKDGHIAEWGPAKQVCDEYERFLFGSNTKSSEKILSSLPELMVNQTNYDPELKVESEVVYGNDQANIDRAWLSDLENNKINVIESCVPFKFNYCVHFNRTTIDPIFSMMIKTREGIALYGLDSTILGTPRCCYEAGDTVKISFILKNPIAPGIYYFNCAVKDSTGNDDLFLARRLDTAVVKIVSTDSTTVMTGFLEMSAEILITS